MSTHRPEAGGAEFPISIFLYSYGLIEAQTPQSLDIQDLRDKGNPTLCYRVNCYFDQL